MREIRDNNYLKRLPKMSASVESEFGAALSSIGYTGQIGKFSPEAMKNDRFVRFLKWATEVCHPSNLVSTHEIKR